MIYLIVGRTSTGKSYLSSKLEEKGLKGVKSYTTRPSRGPNDTDHIFITPDQIKDYEDQIIARTEINGYTYFATHDQIERADFYIIDPRGVYELLKNMPEESYHLVYVHADDKNRKIYALKRIDPTKQDHELNVYHNRNKDEDKQFTEFEQSINQGENSNLFSPYKDGKINAMYFVHNDYTTETLDTWADFLYMLINKRDNVESLVHQAIEKGALASENGLIQVKLDGHTDVKFIKPSKFADLLFFNEDQLDMLIDDILMTKDFFK